MMDTTSVPLMMDIEGGEENIDNKAGLENDFAYNNNVAGASKHVRLGRTITNITTNSCFTPYSVSRLHEEGLRPTLSSADDDDSDRRSVPLHPRREGVRAGQARLLGPGILLVHRTSHRTPH